MPWNSPIRKFEVGVFDEPFNYRETIGFRLAKITLPFKVDHAANEPLVKL
jgi:hypothetical protein